MNENIIDIKQFDDYRVFLKSILSRRQRKNSSYSMRAMARDLHMSASNISEVLNGKKNLSLKRASAICDKLSLNSSESSIFVDLVIKEQQGSAPLKEIVLERLKLNQANREYTVQDKNIFQYISNWYHSAILELIETKDFRNSTEWISDQLNISQEKVLTTIERLLKLGLLKKSANSYKRMNVGLTTTCDIPSDYIREYHDQVLDKAKDALQTQSVEERDFSNMMMAIDPSLIPEAKEKIKEFRRELCEFLESGEKKEVYSLSLQLFRMSKGEVE